MKIFVTGTRGIPHIPGGVEKHCQQLYPLVAADGHDVILATRKPYVITQEPAWQGVLLEHIFAPRQKSLEAFVHTFLGVIKARMSKADLLHIHAVGPGLLVPLARLFGLKVIWTNHGPDYVRDKWGFLAQNMLRLGEWLAGKFANEVIVISAGIQDIVKKRCSRGSHVIYNGVSLPDKSNTIDYLTQLGIIPGKYLLAVARFVPEKGLHDLLEAFSTISFDCQLVIAGDADHETPYSRKIKEAADRNPQVILTGYLIGEHLHQVYSHARLFVLPSYHEGLPIALLEAMSYELPVLVSDIPANKEVELSHERFFRCGNVNELHDKIESLLEKGLSEDELHNYRDQIAEKYNWSKIAEQTISVYRKAMAKR